MRTISLDIVPKYIKNCFQFMDIKKYRAIGINNKRCVVYAKNLTHAKLSAITKLGCKSKSIYRV